MGIEILHRLNKKFLWLVHTKDLLNQALEDMHMLFPNLDVGLITEGKVNIGKDGAIATIQTLVNIDPDLYADQFGTVVCDECLPGDSLISTPNGKKELKNLSNGDIVYSYNRDGFVEEKKVTYLFKHIPNDLYKIKIQSGKEIICTGNHPIYTKRGYIPAKEITPNDYVLQVLPKRIRHKHTTTHNKNEDFKKRLGILFSKLFQNNWFTKKSAKYNTRNEGKMERKYVENKSKSKDERIKRKEKRGSTFRRTQIETKYECQTKGLQFFNSWREWSAYTKASNEFIQLFDPKEIGLFLRVSNSNWKNKNNKFGASYLLQSRYCNTVIYDMYRSGWVKSCKCEISTKRQEKRNFFNWKRVESIEIQEPTSDGTFGGMCKDGYVYNIEVEDNNNYFVDDVLVHNCAHVNGSPTISKMFSKVIEKIPARYKIGLTATPERSDTMIKSMYTLIGMSTGGEFDPTYKVDRYDVKTIEAEHFKYDIDFNYGYSILNSDGTLDYNTLIDYLSDHEERNEIILDNVEMLNSQKRKQVVLCHRVRHVEYMYEKLKERGLRVEMVVGKVTNKKRKQILENCESWDILVATYSLLKEGISIKALDTLHLTTPQKNKSMVVQCAGRIERYMENKNQPIIFDYVDINVPYCLGAYRKRKSSLKNRF